MNQNRIVELDALKGISIIGVLVLHSSFEGRFSQETLSIQATLARLFDWAVLGFFFCSGCLHNSSAPLIMTIKKRAVSLLIPFCLYNLIYNFSFVAMEALGWIPKGTIELNSHLLYTGLFQSPAFQLYFLPYLFLISTGVGGLEKLGQGRYNRVYFAIFLLVILFYLDQGYPTISHGSDYHKLPMYLAMYLIGLICRPFIGMSFAAPWMIMAALAAVLCILVFFRFCEVSLLVPPLLLALAGAVRPVCQIKPLLYLGEMSGSIYVWHTPLVLPAVTRLLAGCGIPSILNLMGSIVLALAICLLARQGLDSMFVILTKKPAPKYITL